MEEFGVAPFSCGGLSVTEELRDDLEANAAIDQIRSERPPQCVRAYVRHVPPILVGGGALADAGAPRDSLHHSPYLG
ncbi:MAG TPA: hypothetical protein VGP67_11600, partial [Gaiellales bacterium]|nr:hypothetical protein [Gaiellales bacterium]